MVFAGRSLPTTMEDLMERIVHAHNVIPHREVAKAVLHMRKRARKCLAVDGGHFEGKLVRDIE